MPTDVSYYFCLTLCSTISGQKATHSIHLCYPLCSDTGWMDDL